MKLQKGFFLSLLFIRFIYQELQEHKSHIPVCCAKGSGLSDAAVVHVLLPGDLCSGPCSVLKSRRRCLSTPFMPTKAPLVLQANPPGILWCSLPLVPSSAHPGHSKRWVKEIHLRAANLPERRNLVEIWLNPSLLEAFQS